MMKKKTTSKWQYAKVLAVIPMTGLALAVFATPQADGLSDQVSTKASETISRIERTALSSNEGQTGALTELVVKDDAKTESVNKPELNSKPDDSEKVYDVVEKMPSFDGGMSTLFKFIDDNVKYPAEAVKQNIQGYVIVNFVVNEDGSVSDAQIVNSVDPLLDAEALRVVGTMPNWEPGYLKGKPVKVKFTVPVAFRLKGDESKQADADKNTSKKLENNLSDCAVIVDGKECASSEIASIDPSTIESVSVRKDAESKKKYAAENKAGVIFIKTKQK